MKKTLSSFLAVVLVAIPCIPLSGCSSNLIDTVVADLPIATDIAVSIVSIVSAGNAAYVQEVTGYAGKVSADLKLMESLIAQYKSNLGAAPGGTAAQINAALNDAQSNLAAILNAIGVTDPKVTAAVSAAVASVKLILNDATLLVQESAPPSVSAQLFFGVGMPVGYPSKDVQKASKVQAQVQKPSGKSARQVAKEYNQRLEQIFRKQR